VSNRAGGQLGAFAAAALVALAAAAPAALAKGSVATASETAPLSSSQAQTASARCPGGMHVTGGGFAVSPVYSPAGGTGTKANVQVSRPDGKKRWVAAAGASQVPLSAGSFTSYARCERNSLGRLAARRTSPTESVGPSASQTESLVCPTRTHILFGGFGTDAPFTVSNPASSQLVVVRSQRDSARQWTVTGYNPGTVAATMTAYFYCESNRGSSKVSSRSQTVPLANDARAEANPACPKHQHVVAGGFSIQPLPVPGIVIPSALVDESMPAGRGWKAGAYENPGYNLPAGSTLTVSAYCKKS
jgi:hypothetical protein